MSFNLPKQSPGAQWCPFKRGQTLRNRMTGEFVRVGGMVAGGVGVWCKPEGKPGGVRIDAAEYDLWEALNELAEILHTLGKN